MPGVLGGLTRRRGRGALAAIAVVAAMTVGMAAPQAADAAAQVRPAVTGWGTAAEVSGFATLNQGSAEVSKSLSCASAGNCTVGGYYTDAAGHQQVFADTETSGTWGTAAEIPGLASLNKHNAEMDSLSCGSAGNCSAGGYYWNDAEGGEEAFVVSQSRGTWGQAEEVPGTESLNVNGTGATEIVSCATAARCAAAGVYGSSTTTGDLQVFVDTQT